MAETEGTSSCNNCGFSPVARYCPRCGQRALGRLELGQLWRDFSSRFLGIEGALATTLWELTVRPGPAIRRYLEGQRRHLLNPFSYLALATAAALLVLSPELPELTLELRQQMDRVFPFLTPAQRDLYLELQIGLARYSALIYVLSSLPFALYFRLLFRSSDLNLAESFVFGLYGYGHVQALSLLPWALSWLVPAVGELDVSSLVGMALWLVYFCWAATGLLGRPVVTSLKILVVLALTYATFLAVHTAALTSIVLLAGANGT